MRTPESVRATGVAPRMVSVAGRDGDPGGRAVLGATVVRVTAEESAVILGESAVGGSVAVISPPSMLAELGEALAGAGIGFGTVGRGALDDTVTLVSVDAVKGLEFDSVVVVEPAALVAEAPQGMRSLYVALTRATRRLSVVHAGPLPEPLVS